MGKLSRETPPPREGEPMGASDNGKSYKRTMQSVDVSGFEIAGVKYVVIFSTRTDYHSAGRK